MGPHSFAITRNWTPTPARVPNGITAGQQHGAVFEAHHGERRFGAVCCCWSRSGRNRLGGFVVVDPVASVVPVSLKVSMVVEGFHGNRGLVP